MHFWFVFAQYSCLCIWLAAMSATAQPGAYAQNHPHLASGENDLKLDQAGIAWVNATPEVRQHVSNGLAELQVSSRLC
jgi:hypothetical protein